MTLGKAFRLAAAWLVLALALVAGAFVASPELRAQTSNRIVFIFDGAGNALSSSLEGAYQSLAVVLIDPATNAPVNYIADSRAAGNSDATTLRSVEATDSQLSAGVGADTASAATAGSVGSLNAKWRFFTGLFINHDDPDVNPTMPMGGRATAHGSNPTAVAAADRTVWRFNRAGVPFVIAGHPNVVRRAVEWADADGAQTNTLIVDISAGTKIVVTAAIATCSAANSTSVAVRVGFGATLPAASVTGTNGIILSQTIAAGSGEGDGEGAGIIATGGDGEDLRYTGGDPVGGACAVKVSFYTIES